MVTLIAALATAGGGWSGSTSLDPWWILAVAGPALVGGALLLVTARALLRRGRYRVVGAFDDSDRAAVREAVAAAERKTVGEILPVVVERSDPHPAGEWLAALSFALVGSVLLATLLPWNHPPLVLASQLLMGAAGFGLARLLPDLKRTFVLENRATAVAEEQALQEFYRNGLQRTAAATGVLIFVSLFERRVVILADEGIDSRVDARFWADTDEKILAGIRRGSLRDGLVAGIDQVGELLSRDFPWREGDRNEIPDRVVVRRE
jgi:putative membrane protein